jgi:hypothetical protein
MISVASETTDIVPPIIAAAGEQAVEQYRAYFNEVIRSQSTRRAYRSQANRFLKWAMRRGLSLVSISADDATDFSRLAHPSVVIPTRRLFRHFVETGVLPANPFLTPHSRKMEAAARIRRLAVAAPSGIDAGSFNRNHRELLAMRAIACAYLRIHRSDDRVFAFVNHLDRQLAGDVKHTSEKPPEE